MELLFKRRNGLEKLNDDGVDTCIGSLKLAVVRFDTLRIILLDCCFSCPASISSTCTIYKRVWV